jgi:diguanylate cyclase (GGDEF)-like protein
VRIQPLAAVFITTGGRGHKACAVNLLGALRVFGASLDATDFVAEAERALAEIAGVASVELHLASEIVREPATRALAVIASDGTPLAWLGLDATPDADRTEALAACLRILGVRLERDRLLAGSRALEYVAGTDALTGIPNRRSLDERLRTEWNRALRGSFPVALLFIDIDLFKGFNDAYGHQAGDACLRDVARAMRDSMSRAGDFVARYGGEEFAAILSHTDQSGAIIIAERVRAAVANLQLTHRGSELGVVSISVGVASRIPHRADTPERLLASADAALYQAKAKGRNRVIGNGYESDAPRTRVRAQSPQTLPLQTTKPIGRAREHERIMGALERDRLVTLCGAAGVGKTYLAVGVAHEMYERYADGVHFIDCRSLSDPELLTTAIAQTCGVHLSADGDVAALTASIARDRRLFVLDGCERMTRAVAIVVEALLDASLHNAALVSSREPLGLRNEVSVRIEPLAPDDAVRMLTVRALARGYRLASTQAERALTYEICELLDRIPGAIDIAAARLSDVSPQELRAALRERRIDGDALTATIASSYDALDERERTLLRRSSVFAGAFARAVGAVCADERLDGVECMELLVQLADKSLLLVEKHDGKQRYRMLDSVREYAGAALERDETEAERVRRRHAEFYRDVATAAEASWASTPSVLWRPPLDLEAANFRNALLWTLGRERDVELGASLAASLMRLWFENGNEREGAHWIERALARRDAVTPATYARLAYAQVRLTINYVPYREALSAAEHSVHLFEAVGDRVGLAYARLTVGGILAEMGDVEAARPLLEESLVAFEELGQKRAVVGALNALAVAALAHREYQTAQQLSERALVASEEAGYDLGAAQLRANLGEIAWICGSYSKARALEDRAIVAFERAGTELLASWARSLYAEAALADGLSDDARAAFERSLDHFETLAPQTLSAQVLDGVARIAMHDGNADDAAVLFGSASAVFESVKEPRAVHYADLYERDLERLRDAAGASVDAALLHGRSLEPIEAFALAREVLTRVAI